MLSFFVCLFFGLGFGGGCFVLLLLLLGAFVSLGKQEARRKRKVGHSRLQDIYKAQLVLND